RPEDYQRIELIRERGVPCTTTTGPFNRCTGSEEKWYDPQTCADSPIPGFDPDTGAKLVPATTALVNDCKNRKAQAELQRQQQAAREQKSRERQDRRERIGRFAQVGHYTGNKHFWSLDGMRLAVSETD